MEFNDNDSNIAAVREAYGKGNLTLYLGAGVSIANGLPPWDKLVLAMYFAAISQQSMGGWRPFPNYLFAIAEWHLSRFHEPLEITARRIRKYYPTDSDFLENLRQTLYAGYFYPESARFEPLKLEELRNANRTLDAVARICERSVINTKGARAVITYNYDELLETALGMFPFQTFWKPTSTVLEKLPIYHVHGFVPIEAGQGSEPEEIVFTEEQYHLAAYDAYSWSNLVQIQNMSSSVGLMIGLSLSDRNMRRLLNAIVSLPHHPTHYALLQAPKWQAPSEAELDDINAKAIEYKKRFEKSGVKKPDIKSKPNSQIKGIIKEVERLDIEQQAFLLNQLGVRPIWYKDHNTDIPKIIDKILAE